MEKGDEFRLSAELIKAREYECEKEVLIRPEDRPYYHLSSRVGWMNDPNGFSWYNGQYHLFYQYHPYDSHWGPMHWGHAVTEDFIHWEYLPCAMAPDTVPDADGCFSGSAITLPDGRHMLMYTGVVKDGEDPFGFTKLVQTQNLAFGDGISYEKYSRNPVLTGKDLPEGGSLFAFRDPRIWKAEDGTYRALAANDNEDSGGQMLLFRSDDALHWTFVKTFARNNNRIGKMWECPDFFNLDGQYVLIGSSQDMLPKELEYHNGNGTFYMFGDYDPETETFYERSNHAIDYGIDFYAPQTLLTPDGRRIMIGWMQNWDTCNLHVKSTPWFGQMSIPRELHVRNGILYQTPVKELNMLRKTEMVHENILIEDRGITLPGVFGRTADMELMIEAADPERMFQKFAVRFAENEEHHTGVSFRPHESILKIDRKFSGSRRAIIHQRRALVRHDRGKIKLHLLIDRFSVEVFVNDGEKVLSATINTDPRADGISFHADGSVRISVRHCHLK
ncbi:MAG: glycoside hydrolase family 32 protein [Lachnospiraceae bacterium]|nr:glycoside hydrolase family 32 protein [Lachnospiraceae bacterium]